MTKKGFEQIVRAAGVGARMVRRHRLRSLAPASITGSLDAIELGALEVWIADQPDPKPSRQEAVRRLIAEALVRR
jgi:hypothetical protein